MQARKLMTRTSVLALAIAFVLVLASGAQAATFTVNTTADNAPVAGECSGAAGDCSIRQAIDAANANPGDDTITIPAGHYVMSIAPTGPDDNASGDFNVANAGALTIQGATGNSADVLIDGAGIDGVLSLDTGANVTVANVTIEDGFSNILTVAGSRSAGDGAGGGIYVGTNATLTLDAARVIRNTANDGDGGGIFGDFGSTLNINSSNVDQNTSYQNGGGIAYFGTLALNNSTVDGNSANGDDRIGGGGVFDQGTGLTSNNSSVSNNQTSAETDGGGIYDNASDISLTGSHVDGNQANEDGGGISLESFSVSAQTRGAGPSAAGNVSITGTTLIHNVAVDSDGGAIYNDSSPSLTLTNATLNDNSSNGDGGAIYNDNGTLSVTGSTLDNNAGQDSLGGAIYNDGTSVTIASSELNSNVASGEFCIYCIAGSRLGFFISGSGGAIYNDNGPLSISGSTIDDNTAFADAGGVYNDGDNVTIDSSHVDGNKATNFVGGGIENDGDGATLTLTGSTVSGNNSLSAGGGIANDSGDVSITDSHVDNNRVGNSSGGGIYSTTGQLTVTRSSVDGNVAASDSSVDATTRVGQRFQQGRLTPTTLKDGGGIYNAGAGTTIDRSSVSKNSAFGDGGGLFNDTGNSADQISNSTFANDTANAAATDSAFDGGGIYENSGLLTLINDTIAGDQASAGDGGGIFVPVAPVIKAGTRQKSIAGVTLTNTIIADNFAPNGNANCNDPSGFTSNGHNLEDDTGSTSQCNLDTTGANGDLQVADARLLPLADNGGGTLTRALSFNSPALDKADNGVCAASPINNVDQRGATRPAGPACDIGAYELQAPVAVNDAYSTPFNTPLHVSPNGVMGNDSEDPGGGPLSSALNAGPAHGTVTLNADGSFTYAPATGFSGVDTFTYHNNDGHLDSNVATVTITVPAAAASRGVLARVASRGPKRCVRAAFTYRFTINSASRITRVTVNGRRIRIGNRHTFTIKLNARKQRSGRHTLVIKVTNASGTTTRRVHYTRCARPRRISPKFTG